MIHFCRFYFVGDEDLLEIIGNSKNLPRLQKHFKKMFAGIHQIILDEEQTQVLGIASKEGEKVTICYERHCPSGLILYAVYYFRELLARSGA